MAFLACRSRSAALGASFLAAATAFASASLRQEEAPAAGPAPEAAEPKGKALPAAERVRPATPDDLEFRPGTLVLVTDEATGQRYAVFTYVVVNKTARTQRFTPRFELLTGEGRLLVGGSDVPPDAAVRIRRAASGPRSLDQFQIMGDIAVGEANAKEGVVIFPASGDLKDLTLFVSGMSMAFDFVTDPATGAPVNDPKSGRPAVVRRSWSRHYSIPGVSDPRESPEARFDVTKDAWVMR
jgi:hypothetical protein